MKSDVNFSAQIDILMPVYNGERFIRQALDSVLGQTFSDWRLIIINDLSTDQTPEIIEEYQKRDPRIVCVMGAHQGVAVALNTGLEYVTAPWVARLDADDMALPERLQKQQAYLVQHPDVMVVGSNVILIDETGKQLRTRKMPQGWETVRNTLKTRNCVCHPSVLIRSDVLKAVGGYRAKFKNSQDYDLWLRISEIGKIENFPESLLLYRHHTGQISNSANSHKQTIYSVAAAIDFFIRKYHLPIQETVLDGNDHDDLALKLVKIYQSEQLPVSDTTSLNRHAIRFLRHCKGLNSQVVTQLHQAMRGYLSWNEILKYQFYKVLNYFK